jgi:hypothetical protein
MLKKKDQLLEILKKEDKYHLTQYLDIIDIATLSTVSKRYYVQLVPMVHAFKLDQEVEQTSNKPKNKPKKQKQKEEATDLEPQTEVEIEKVPLSKFRKYKFAGSSWAKVEQLDFRNDYLAKKMESRTVVFYRNLDSGELIFVNRSMVDPTLNYNKGGFGEDFVTNDIYQHFY